MRIFLLFAAASLVSSAACVVEDIEPGGSVNGTLAAECRVRDVDPLSRSTSYARPYRIKVTSQTVLTVRLNSAGFNPYLSVYSASGTAMAVNDDADGGTNSRISISLNPGQYTLLASSAAVATGAFTMSTSPEGLRSCPVRDLAPADPVTGSLTASGCRTLDLRVPSTDDRPVDRYRVVASRRSVVTFDMTSADFDTYLELRDSNGARMAADHASAGANHSRLISSVASGTYTVYAYPWRTAAGSYTLAPVLEAPRACPAKDIEPGATVNASFTGQSCRYLDLVTPSSDETYVEPYRLTLAKPAVVTVSQKSKVVDSYLIVAGTDLETIFENNDVDESTADARVLGSLKAGTYLVLANEFDAAAGTYSITLETEDPRSCPVKDMAAGAAVSGTFSETSCRFLDLVQPAEDETYVEAYRVTLARRSVMTLEMKSAAVDTYLVVTTPTYEAIFTNDDASDNTTNSRVLGSLEAGTYVVLATMYETETGDYSLTLAAEDARACPAKDIGRADSVSGTLSDSSCRYLDLIVPSDDPTPLDVYRLAAASRGMLSLEVSAKGFSPYLVLTNSEYESYWENEGDTAVQTELLVLPGTYYVLVNSLSRGGDYTMKTQFAAARDCPSAGIGVQDTQQGSLQQGGCRFRDMVPFAEESMLTNQHKIVLTQRGALTVTAGSTDFAPSLFIADESNTQARASDLNPGGSSSAQAGATLPAGTYNILVFTLAGGAGRYELTTTFDRGGVVQSESSFK